MTIGQDPHESGHDRLVELELLGDQIAEAEDAGQIAPGMPRNLRMHSGPDRIDGVEEDDRGVRLLRRGLRLADRMILERDDQVDVLTDERLRLRLRLVLVRQVDSRDQVDVAALVEPSSLRRAFNGLSEGGTRSSPTRMSPTRGIGWAAWSPALELPQAASSARHRSETEQPGGQRSAEL